MTESIINGDGLVIGRQNPSEKTKKLDNADRCPPRDVLQDENYWRLRFEKLQADYNHLQKINQSLEEKLLNVVETFEKKKDELIANIEYEKSTLMADVNKLSNKLVDAKIKLHDHQEREQIHAAECDAPCHKNGTDKSTAKLECNQPNLVPRQKQQQQQVTQDNNCNDTYDPNLV